MDTKNYSEFSIIDNFKFVNGYIFPQYKAFTAAVPATGNEPGIELGPIMIRAVADLNNDGFDDIVFDTYDVLQKYPTILFSNGDGTFRASAVISGDAQQRTEREIKIVDINNDGLKDIICFPAAHPSLVSWANPLVAEKWDATEHQIVLINQGSEKFTLKQDIYNLQEGYFHSGEVADINGDGLLDIYPLNEYPSWQLELGGGKRLPVLQNPDGSFSLAAAGLPKIFENYRTINIAIGDINHDQINDYAIAIYPYPDNLKPKTTANLPPLMAIAIGQKGKGVDALDWQFVGKHWIDQATIDRLYVNGAKYIDAGAQLVDFIDIDQDGEMEILLSEFIDTGSNMQGGYIAIYHWNGSNVIDVTSQFIPFQIANQQETGFVMEKYLVDLNGDGKKDFVFSGYFDYSKTNTPYVNDIFLMENGIFKPALDGTLSAGNGIGRPEFLVSGDFNGDGAPDIAGVSGLIEKDPITGQYLNKNASIVTYLNQIKPARLTNIAVTGTAASDKLDLAANDSVRGLGGNDEISGISGVVQKSLYWGIAKDYILKREFDNSWYVDGKAQNEGIDHLINIERLGFSDINIALDLNSNAGTTAKILGAVFGKDSVQNKQYVGIGLDLLDKGMDYSTLAGLAVNAAGLKTNDQIVSTLWKNIVGTTASATDKAPFIELLEHGMTVGDLAKLAAETSLNTTNINLVGLAATGLEYLPVT